jgi:hypothetical protein
VVLTVQQVRDGERGITTHRVVTEAMMTPGGHWDPGPDFPMDAFVGGVAWMLMRLGNPEVKVDGDG